MGGREREKRTGVSVLEVSTVTFITKAKKLPPDNGTLPGRISYTFLEELMQVCILWTVTSQRSLPDDFWLVHVLDQRYCPT